MMRSLTLALFFVFAACSLYTVLPISPLHAQTNTQKAKKLHLESRKLSRQKNLPAAISTLQEALALQDNAAWTLELAQLQERNGDLFPALRSIRTFLASSPKGRQERTARKLLKTLEERTATRMATVHINTPLEGLHVYVDEMRTELACTTPCTLSLSPEKHTLQVGGNQGTQAQSKSIHPKPSETLRLTFEPEGSSPKLGTLYPKSNAPPGAVLFLDGAPKATFPISKAISLEAGVYPASIVSKNNTTLWSGSITIEPNTEHRPTLQTSPDDTTSGLTIAAYSLWGLSAASLGAGIYFGLDASNIEDTLSTTTSAGKPADAALIRDGETQSRNANIFFATSAVMAGSGLLLYLLGDTESAALSTISILPQKESFRVQINTSF